MKVLDNIYVAINFGLANCIMIEGEDGVIIIDTMEGPEPAREVLEEFRRITDKPIVGIILTHFHADHVYGIETFLAAAGPGGNRKRWGLILATATSTETAARYSSQLS